MHHRVQWKQQHWRNSRENSNKYRWWFVLFYFVCMYVFTLYLHSFVSILWQAIRLFTNEKSTSLCSLCCQMFRIQSVITTKTQQTDKIQTPSRGMGSRKRKCTVHAHTPSDLNNKIEGVDEYKLSHSYTHAHTFTAYFIICWLQPAFIPSNTSLYVGFSCVCVYPGENASHNLFTINSLSSFDCLRNKDRNFGQVQIGSLHKYHNKNK